MTPGDLSKESARGRHDQSRLKTKQGWSHTAISGHWVKSFCRMPGFNTKAAAANRDIRLVTQRLPTFLHVQKFFHWNMSVFLESELIDSFIRLLVSRFVYPIWTRKDRVLFSLSLNAFPQRNLDMWKRYKNVPKFFKKQSTSCMLGQRFLTGLTEEKWSMKRV